MSLFTYLPASRLWQLFIEPFSIDFMWQALWLGSFTAVVCALLSSFVIRQGWSLIGDAVSHAVLPGIILAHWLAIPLLVGALISGLGCIMFTGFIDARTRVKSDALLGVSYTTFLALGLVLMSLYPSSVHFTHVLLGNLLGITTEARYQLLMAGGIALLCLILRFRDLKLFCFDPRHARAIGLNVVLLRYLLLACLGLTTVAALQAVGLVQAIAMLVAPGCIAALASRHFTRGMLLSAVIAVLSVWWGLVIAFAVDIAPGGCIVLVQSLFFLLILTVTMIRHALSSRAPGRGSSEEKGPVQVA